MMNTKGKAASDFDQRLVALARDWQKAERESIAAAEKEALRAGNPLVSLIMGMIVHDARKHELVQQALIDSLTKEALHVSPDELNALAGRLNEHIREEEEFCRLAEDALRKSELVSTRFFLQHLIADAKRHRDLARQLDEIRNASIATSATART